MVVVSEAPVTVRRSLSGQLVRRVVEESRTARLEVIERRAHGKVTWTFCQPRPAVFWFTHGVRRVRLSVDGRPVEATVSPLANLGLVAAAASLDGEIETAEHYRYAVAFLDEAKLGVLQGFRRSLFAFGNPAVQSSFAELVRKAGRSDATFSLLLEGWSLQTLARLSGLQQAAGGETDRQSALPTDSLHLVTEFVRCRYADPLTVKALADIAGYSARHFARAFRGSTGQTPMEFVSDVRIAKAKEMLTAGRASITDVALSCGFSQAQHFSVVFRRSTGFSPRQYALRQG